MATAHRGNTSKKPVSPLTAQPCLSPCIQVGQWRTGSAVQNFLLVYWKWSWETYPEAQFCSAEPIFVPSASESNDGTHLTHCLESYRVQYSYSHNPIPLLQSPKISSKNTWLLGVRRKFSLGILCMVTAVSGGGTRSPVTATDEGSRANHWPWDPLTPWGTAVLTFQTHVMSTWSNQQVPANRQEPGRWKKKIKIPYYALLRC